MKKLNWLLLGIIVLLSSCSNGADVYRNPNFVVESISDASSDYVHGMVRFCYNKFG